jgi:CheY-like chemotaxis protein
LQEGLTAHGMHVTVAANGREALGILRKRAVSSRPLQLMLLDYPLPNDDSTGLTRILRADPNSLHDIRVIS